MLTLWGLVTETVFHKKILGSYVEFLLSILWKKNGKGDEITTSLQGCDIGAREKLQCVWLSEVNTLAAECVNCKNNLEAKSENK